MIWSVALVFTVAGIVGALLGSTPGKMLDGQKLLALFALVVQVIATLMLVALYMLARILLPH